MLNSQFVMCLEVLKDYEGGWVDDAADRGGATKCGITQRVYDAFRRRSQVPVQTVRNATDDEIASIYRSQYYQPMYCNVMEPGWALAIFDTTVLCGEGDATEWLHQVLRIVSTSIGPDTIKAIKTAKIDRLDAFLDLRLAHHRGVVARDSTQERFLAGWEARVSRLRARCYTLEPFRV